MRKPWRQIDRLNLQSQIQKENRCEQSISQRGSSGCVDCTEIMYSAVQNGKLTRGKEEGRERSREDEGTLRLSFPRVALHCSYPSPVVVGVTMVCKGD